MWAVTNVNERLWVVDISQVDIGAQNAFLSRAHYDTEVSGFLEEVSGRARFVARTTKTEE